MSVIERYKQEQSGAAQRSMRGSARTEADLINPAARIVEAIVEDIVLGKLHARERLVEDDLVERFDEKRHLVRQALLELEQMGLVDRIPNKGAMIKSYSADAVRQIYAVRTILEGEAARLIPLPLPKERLDQLMSIQAEHDDAVRQDDVRRAFRTNVAFHRSLFLNCDNPYLVGSIESLAQKIHAIRFYALMDPDLRRQGSDEHAAIVQAIEACDRDKLVELCVNHLTPCKNAYLKAKSF